MPVVGDAPDDYALAVFFEDLDDTFWFRPELLEPVNADGSPFVVVPGRDLSLEPRSPPEETVVTKFAVLAQIGLTGSRRVPSNKRMQLAVTLTVCQADVFRTGTAERTMINKRMQLADVSGEAALFALRDHSPHRCGGHPWRSDTRQSVIAISSLRPCPSLGATSSTSPTPGQ
jgi:hypothetical protein